MYTTIVADQRLNFNRDYPINALFRIRNGCERIIYFTDNYNPYRVINITDTSEWVTGVSLVDPKKIIFTRPFVPPTINVPDFAQVIQDGGGNLEYGSYALYFRYLDDDLNPTFMWLPVSHYISIANGSQSNYSNSLLNGAANEESSPYYADRSSAAIKVKFTDLDTSFKYYQLAVLKRTDESGAVSGVDILNPKPITSDTDTTVYTGYDSQIYNQGSVDELLVPTKAVHKVKAHEIGERKLFLSNLTAPERDYSKYQAYASSIKVTYTATKIDERQAKRGSVQLYGETLCPDEIYALGIVYVHADGTESPVFHIPGRPADINMTGHTNPYITSHTNWDTDNIVGDDNVFDDAKTARWQVYSTATIETATSNTNTHKGYLGYYQTTTTYADLEDCDGNNYWGEDYYGNTITSSDYVRHHRMPGQYMYVGAGQATHKQYDINLTYDNVTAPNSDVIGWYFVYGDRTEERTVLDRGFIRTLNWDPTDEVNYWRSVNHDSVILNTDTSKRNYYGFLSPYTVYKNKAFSADYIQIEKVLETSSTVGADIDPGTSVSVYNGEFDITMNVDTSIYEFTTFERPERLNYTVDSSSYLNPVPEGKIKVLPTDSNSTYIQTDAGDRIENRSMNHGIGIYEFSDNEYIQEFDNYGISCGLDSCQPDGSQNYVGFVATIKANRDVFENLYSIQYKKLHNNMIDYNPITVVAGDQFIPYFDNLEQFYDSSSPEVEFATTPLVHELNTELRYYSESDVGRYTWYRYRGGYEHDPLARHIASKYYETSANDGVFFKEHYNLSDKYNFNAADNYYYPIPFNYDLCAACNEDEPYRIYYSDTDNEETTNDKFRIIRANNYANIEGEDGPVTDLFSVFNQLYLTTENSILRIPIKAQSVQTNEGSIYIGTAETLSLPFLDLYASDYAIGGMQNFKSRILTEFGAVYVDPKSARVYLLNDKLNDLSTTGLRNFWKENGEIYFLKQYEQLTGNTYPHTFLTSDVGVGYIITFDPRYKRVIIHKRDYEILPEYTTGFTDDALEAGVGDLWFNGTDFKYEESLSTLNVELGNPLYFRDRSFTISYSFITNSWVSFHSYNPYYFFNTHNTFYSSGPWKHNDGEFQTYYDTKYPHVIDLIAAQNQIQGKLGQAVYYTAYTEEYDALNRDYRKVDSTFDGLVAYNSRQSSGYQPMSLKTNPFESDTLGSVLVDYVDNHYRLNDLRDLTINNNDPIWTKDWQFLSTTPYLDKIPNSNNLNLGQSFFTQKRFRDHYLGLRFFFNPRNNYRITTDLVSTLYANRNR